jgi:hypothetical protein
MEKSSTELNTDDEMNHTPECLAESLKKVVIDESKNMVQEPPQLKPDTPKIPLKQWVYKYLLNDSFTDSIVGMYDSNNKAVRIMIDLVKKDIINYIDLYQKKILQGESIEENRNYLSLIKNLLYQYRNIENSRNTCIMLEGKSVNRYRIMMVKEDEQEPDESDYLNF